MGDTGSSYVCGHVRHVIPVTYQSGPRLLDPAGRSEGWLSSQARAAQSSTAAALLVVPDLHYPKKIGEIHGLQGFEDTRDEHRTRRRVTFATRVAVDLILPTPVL
ncbi:hypothetical protein GCM10009634_37430 [Saccharothrix xinjiangensis]